MIAPLLLTALLGPAVVPRVGLVAGSAVGINLAARVDDRLMMQIDVMRTISVTRHYIVGLDMLLRVPEVGGTLGDVRLVPYAGAGMRFDSSTDEGESLGVRLPIGIALEPEDSPIEAFVELSPSFPLPGGAERATYDLLGGIRMQL